MQCAAWALDADAERRLRPIAEAIYALNFKQAVKLSEKLDDEKKSTPSVYMSARALRCVALHRMGHITAASLLASSIIASDLDPNSNSMIDAACAYHLQFYFRDARNELPMSAIFDKLLVSYLAKLETTNLANFGATYAAMEPWLNRITDSSFVTNLICQEYSAAQKIAAKVNKSSLKNANAFIGWWPSFALYTQVRDANHPSLNPPESDPRLKTLLTAMISSKWKAFTESHTSGAVDAAELARYALEVLMECNSFEAASKILDESEKFLPVLWDRLEMRARLSMAEGAFSKTADIARQLIKEESVDNWQYWRILFLSEQDPLALQAFINEACHMKSPETEQQPQQEQSQNGEVPVTATKVIKKRAPYLSKILLEYRKTANSASSSSDDLIKAMWEYFDTFGKKTVVVNDLKPYISILEGKDRVIFLERMKAEYPNRSKPEQLHMLWLTLHAEVDAKSRDQALAPTFAAMSQNTQALFDSYLSLIQLSLEETERQPGDDFLLLCVFSLLRLSCPPAKFPQNLEMQSAELEKLHSAIAVLEVGLRNSPFNFSFKLLMIRLLQRAGAPKAAYVLWRSMDIKHIQFASMSHWVLSGLSESLLHDECLELGDDIEVLEEEAIRDVPQGLIRALRLGSFPSCRDFLDFSRRLSVSSALMHNDIIRLQTMITRVMLKFSSKKESEIDHIELKRIRGYYHRTRDFRKLGGVRSNDDRECMAFWDETGNHQYYDKDIRAIAQSAPPSMPNGGEKFPVEACSALYHLAFEIHGANRSGPLLSPLAHDFLKLQLGILPRAVAFLIAEDDTFAFAGNPSTTNANTNAKTTSPNPDRPGEEPLDKQAELLSTLIPLLGALQQGLHADPDLQPHREYSQSCVRFDSYLTYFTNLSAVLQGVYVVSKAGAASKGRKSAQSQPGSVENTEEMETFQRLLREAVEGIQCKSGELRKLVFMQSSKDPSKASLNNASLPELTVFCEMGLLWPSCLIAKLKRVFAKKKIPALALFDSYANTVHDLASDWKANLEPQSDSGFSIYPDALRSTSISLGTHVKTTRYTVMKGASRSTLFGDIIDSFKGGQESTIALQEHVGATIRNEQRRLLSSLSNVLEVAAQQNSKKEY